MWTTATREKYSRTGSRYQSDVTDEEWRVIEPLLPEPNEPRGAGPANKRPAPAMVSRSATMATISAVATTICPHNCSDHDHWPGHPFLGAA